MSILYVFICMSHAKIGTRKVTVMAKIDLITGFLGSGKTTFIKKYARYLHAHGERVGIIENDYGAVNVDMLLMNELKEEGIGLEMVAGGCDYDCHRRRFRTKLLTMALLGYTRVIVEPSGIFDVDEFFDLLHEDDLYDRYEVSNVIAIVNANLEDGFSEEADYMLASQCADAGKVVFSFVQNSTEETMENTKEHIRTALEKIQCRRKLEDAVFFAKDWSELDDADYEIFRNAGYRETGYVKKYSMDHNSFESLFFMNCDDTADEILGAVERLWKDSSAGRIMRIKGFALRDEQWVEINSTKECTSVNPIREGQKILIVIGEELHAEVIASYFHSEYSSIKTQ